MKVFRLTASWLRERALRSSAWLMGHKDAILPLGVVVALFTFWFNLAVEWSRWQSGLSVRVTAIDADVYLHPAPPGKTTTETMHLVLRNQSYRPTAILSIALGNKPPELSRKYRERLRLPVIVSAWGVQELRVPIDIMDWSGADVLILDDLDDKKIKIPLPSPNLSKWYK